MSGGNTFGVMKGLVVFFMTILMLLRPLSPLAEYIINYDYIVNVLCENRKKPQLQCNGKCYLAKQFSKESKQNQKNPFSEKKVVEMPEILDTSLYSNLDNDHFFYSDIGANFWPTSNLNKLLFVFEKIQPPENG